ncbi:MAG: hypothetical protein ACREJP_11100, partial [Candidatus Methylomirabilales bacterium]
MTSDVDGEDEKRDSNAPHCAMLDLVGPASRSARSGHRRTDEDELSTTESSAKLMSATDPANNTGREADDRFGNVPRQRRYLGSPGPAELPRPCWVGRGQDGDAA